jgi:hypothetical protein
MPPRQAGRPAGFILSTLRARGHRSSQVGNVQARVLDNVTALVSSACVRNGKEGETLQHFGQTCTMRRSKGLWRIAVNTIHHPISVLTL